MIALSGPIRIALSFACHAVESHNGVIVMTPHSFICTVPVNSENSPLLLTRHLLAQCFRIRGILVDAVRWHYGIFHSRQIFSLQFTPLLPVLL